MRLLIVDSASAKIELRRYGYTPGGALPPPFVLPPELLNPPQSVPPLQQQVTIPSYQLPEEEAPELLEKPRLGQGTIGVIAILLVIIIILIIMIRRLKI